MVIRKLPLEGIRIIDLTHVWSGPHCVRLLADMGAEAIKVESQNRLDPSRGLPAGEPPPGRYADGNPGDRPYERTANLHQNNRNKYSITIDLSKEEGVELFKKVAAISDIVIDNFSLGVMERFGLGYTALKKIKPDIIVMSMPAFGDSGPESHFRAYGITQEPLSGIQGLSGYIGGPPMKTGVQIGDPLNGVHAAGALLAALWYRRRTGKGQFIDFSQLESPIAAIGDVMMDYFMNKRIPARMGNRHPVMAPHGCYRCLGEDKWVTIAVSSDQQWPALCQVLGRQELANDSRFADIISRAENQDELDPIITEWTSRRGHLQAMIELQGAGIAAGAVLNTEEIARDPQFKARGYFKTFTHIEVGRRNTDGMAWKLSKTPGRIRRPAPCFGEHNEYVFGQLLGISEKEIKELEERGITGKVPLEALRDGVLPR
ncbi:CaiB/BaiF CoA transferase family protein [Chloroflexota bacterium]